MKKIALTICLALASACSFAQKGQWELGGHLGPGICVESGASLTNFDLGADVRYGLSNDWRLDFDVEGGFKSKHVGLFDLALNVNYLARVSRKVDIYPMVGIGFAHPTGWHEDNSVLVNAGVGVDWAFAPSFTAGVEIKYQYIDDFQRVPIHFQVAYKF